MTDETVTATPPAPARPEVLAVIAAGKTRGETT